MITIKTNAKYTTKEYIFCTQTSEQTVKLVVKTLKRLSVAAGGTHCRKNNWEHTYCFMNDAVFTNLLVEEKVAKVLKSTHIHTNLRFVQITYVPKI